MHIKIMKKKTIKITNLSFKLKKMLFFRKYNYMSKIFPKIYFKFDSNITTHNQIYKYA